MTLRPAPRQMAACAAALLLPLAGCRTPRPGARHSILITSGPAWVGVTPAQQAGLQMLLADLATTSGATVFEAGRPDDPGAQDLQRLALDGTRLPDGTLHLQGHLQTPGLPDRDVAPLTPDPNLQMQEILAAANLRSSESAAILPRDPGHLLPLAEVCGTALAGNESEATQGAQAAAELEAEEPRNAPAAFARGADLYLLLLAPGAPDLQSQSSCGAEFDRALDLSRGYPRAAALAGRFHTDTGDQRRALAILREATGRWPRAAGLMPTVAYAARTTGLLDIARAALQKEDALAGSLPEALLLTRNSDLYAGAWDRFQVSLGTGTDERPDPMRDFYRGYIRLLRGSADEALTFFRKAALPTSESPAFQSLAMVYRLALEGHRPEALLALRNLARSRHEARIPDGEFTFKLAEAFCFLAQPEEGMDAAQLAFSQGFGCTPWFERTPLLAPLHELPRWRALISHLRARQQLLEAEFPAKAFGG